MTDNEFSLALQGQGRHVTQDGSTRIRYIVADTFTALGTELRQAGRRDRGGLCSYLASTISSGGTPSKKSLTKARKEIDAVRQRLVDGVPLLPSPDLPDTSSQ